MLVIKFVDVRRTDRCCSQIVHSTSGAGLAGAPGQWRQIGGRSDVWVPTAYGSSIDEV